MFILDNNYRHEKESYMDENERLVCLYLGIVWKVRKLVPFNSMELTNQFFIYLSYPLFIYCIHIKTFRSICLFFNMSKFTIETAKSVYRR